jgi:hypothetical protein
MFKKTLISLAVASSVGLTGCFDSGETGANANPDYQISNPDFTGQTWPILNGLTQEFPVPNDILTLLNPVGDGTMLDGSDPSNPVTTGIGFLDGNSTVGAFDIKLSGSIDPNQTLDARTFVEVGGNILPNPDQNVFLLPLTFPSGDPLLQADGEVPSFAEAIRFQQAAALGQAGDSAQAGAILADLAQPVARAEIISLDEGNNNVIRINPLTPLEPKTKYLVVITNSVEDIDGDPLVASPAYQNYRDPSQPLGNDRLAAFRDAILQWEQLADGYFGFMQDVYERASAPFNAPSKDDIVFSITFSTTAIEDVLEANAAPRTFLEQSARTDARKAAITALINSDYNLTNQPIESDEPADLGINNAIYQLLTDPSQGFELFNAELAGILTQANSAGVTLSYSDVAIDSDGELDSTLAFALQSAASRASVDVKGETIATETAQAEAGFSGLGAFDVPKARPVNVVVEATPANELYDVLPESAQVVQAEITLPYYLGIPDVTGDPAQNVALLQGYSWQSNQEDALQNPPVEQLPNVVAPSDKVSYRFPFAQKTGDITVPAAITYPDEVTLGAAGISKPAEGWPVIIYQHGITTDRSATLPLATAMANACVQPDTDEQGNVIGVSATGLDCYATVAIDQPLHGITPNGGTLTLAGIPGPGLSMIRNLEEEVIEGASADATERHFNFAANAELLAAPMASLPAEAQVSGSLFINLSNFANSRDNLRQGVLDLLNLNASLENIADIDTDRVYFVGHSLGGINGIPFVAVNNAVAGTGVNAALPEVKASAFLMTGGGIPKLLENSPNTNFGAPRILAGLAAASDGVLVQGSSALETYLSVLQGVLDSTDPINYGSMLSDSRSLLTVAIGDDTIPNEADENPLNITLPNGFEINSLPAPLAGTDPLVAEFGATKEGLPKVVEYEDATHGTPVSAQPSAEFGQIVLELATLFRED